MKNTLIVFCFIAITQLAAAQRDLYRWNVGTKISGPNFSRMSEIEAPSENNLGSLHLLLGKRLNDAWETRLQLINSDAANTNFNQKKIAADLGIFYYSDNAKFLRERSLIAPYAGLGAGYGYNEVLIDEVTEVTQTIHISVELGLKFRWSDRFTSNLSFNSFKPWQSIEKLPETTVDNLYNNFGLSLTYHFGLRKLKRTAPVFYVGPNDDDLMWFLTISKNSYYLKMEKITPKSPLSNQWETSEFSRQILALVTGNSLNIDNSPIIGIETEIMVDDTAPSLPATVVQKNDAPNETLAILEAEELKDDDLQEAVLDMLKDNANIENGEDIADIETAMTEQNIESEVSENELFDGFLDLMKSDAAEEELTPIQSIEKLVKDDIKNADKPAYFDQKPKVNPKVVSKTKPGENVDELKAEQNYTSYENRLEKPYEQNPVEYNNNLYTPYTFKEQSTNIVEETKEREPYTNNAQNNRSERRNKQEPNNDQLDDLSKRMDLMLDMMRQMTDLYQQQKTTNYSEETKRESAIEELDPRVVKSVPNAAPANDFTPVIQSNPSLDEAYLALQRKYDATAQKQDEQALKILALQNQLNQLVLASKLKEEPISEVVTEKDHSSMVSNNVSEVKMSTNNNLFEDNHWVFTYPVNQYELTSKQQALIDSLILLLDKNKELVVSIAGYSDGVGTPGYNQKLSAWRVDKVKNRFIVKGIDSSRIMDRAFGDRFSGGVRHELERKVEIKLLKVVR